MTAGNAATATFVLLPGETVLPLRVMLDTRSVEIFAAGGRGKHVNIDTDLLSVCLLHSFFYLFPILERAMVFWYTCNVIKIKYLRRYMAILAIEHRWICANRYCSLRFFLFSFFSLFLFSLQVFIQDPFRTTFVRPARVQSTWWAQLQQPPQPSPVQRG